MPICPNKSLKSWKTLDSMIPDISHYVWDKLSGEISDNGKPLENEKESERFATLLEKNNNNFYDTYLEYLHSTNNENINDVNLDKSVELNKYKSLSKVAELRHRVLTSLQSRYKTFSKQGKTQEVLTKMSELQQDIANSEAELGLYKFILDAEGEVNRLITDGQIDKWIKNPDTINSSLIDQMYSNFLGFYKPLTESLNAMVAFKDDFSFVDPDKRTEIVGRLGKLLNNLTKLEIAYKELRAYDANRLLENAARESGAINYENPVAEFNSLDMDESSLFNALGFLRNAKTSTLRAVNYVVSNLKNNINRQVLTKGKDLVSKLKELSDPELVHQLYEMEDGKATGFLLSEYKMGKAYREYYDFLDAIKKKYGLQEHEYQPFDPEEAKKYNKELNEWKDKHQERRYTKEYYDLFADLHPLAREMRDNVQKDINKILDKVTDDFGNVSLDNLTQIDYERYLSLQFKKKNLGNLYYDDGTPKSDTDLLIAKSIKELNEKLENNLKYTKSQERFDEAYAKVKETYKSKYTDPEKYESHVKSWYYRNTTVKPNEDFYKSLETIEKNNYGNVYDDLSKEKKELLRLGRREDGAPIAEQLHERVKDRIKEIDIQQNKIREDYWEQHKGQNAKEGPKFDDLATIINTPFYNTKFAEVSRIDQEMKEKGQSANYLQEWWDRNHYIDSKGNWHPTSVWTMVWPRNNEHLVTEPNMNWAEVNKNSPWYNNNFDESFPYEGFQPKKSLYDNSKEFAKIKANPKLLAYRQSILDTIKESNQKVSVLKNRNSLMLPQISKGFMDRLKDSSGNILTNFKTLMKKEFTSRVDDDIFMDDTIRRPDGTITKFVPIRYTNKLENSDDISRDLTSLVIQYYEMATNHEETSKLAPTLNNLTEELKSKIVDTGNKTKVGAETNMYKKLIAYLDTHLYGKEKDKVEVRFGDSNVNVTKILSNIANWTRLTGLFKNFYAIQANVVANTINSRIEASLGRYVTNNRLNKAKREVYLNLTNIMNESGKSHKSNKIMGMMEYNQIARSNHEIFDNLDKKRLARHLASHFWYGEYEAGDFVVKAPIVLANYYSYKLIDNKFISANDYAKDGRTIDQFDKLQVPTLYDAYEMKDGKFSVKSEYKKLVDEILENKIKNKSTVMAANLDGVLTDLDKSAMHQHAWGQLLLIFRGWMLGGAQTKFKSKGYNYLTGEIEEGQFNTMWRYLGNTVKDLKNYQMIYDQLSPEEKYNVKKTTREATVIAVLTLLTILMDGAAKDDDDDNWALQMTAYMVSRAMFEQASFYNPMEIVGVLNSPSPSTNLLTQIMAIKDIFFPSTWTQPIERGSYKGMNKLERSMIKLSPLRAMWEIQDPKGKRLYLENQIMQ